jgi:hypothetical protein
MIKNNKLILTENEAFLLLVMISTIGSLMTLLILTLSAGF